MADPTDDTPARRRRGLLPVLLGLLAYVLTWLGNRSLRRVDGPSMLPSLWPGDLLLTVPATLLTPRPGDVVVAEVAGHRVTKRLVAPPGARVELRDGHLLVDGVWWAAPDAVPVDEDTAWQPSGDEAVLLGDHRARSTDARSAGPVAHEAIDRVAVARLRPFAWLRGRAVPLAGPRTRPGVRLVVLDAEDRVLLFRVTDADGGDATWWEAPGGGRHVGETPLAAAARELAEEVGATEQRLVPLGEVHVRHTILAGADLVKVEDVFAVRLATPDVDTRGWTANEVRDIAEVRWWAPGDLEALTPGELVPDDLVRLATRARALV